jgi:cytochrome c5
MKRAWKAATAAVLMGLALTGCDQKSQPGEPVQLDGRLSEVYGHTCQTCHENAESGAPLAHDEAAWKPRIAQGDEVLADHIVNGYKGMPPLGQCIECSKEDLMALMHFMAAPAPAPEKKN